MFRQLLACVMVMIAVKAEAASTIRLGYTVSTDSPVGLGSDSFATELSKSLPGRYRVEMNPNAKLGGDAEMLKALQFGSLDMVTAAGGGAMSNVVPECAVLDLPFLLRDDAHADAVLDGPIGDEILASFESHGIIALAWGEQGFRDITNAARPIRRASDLAGLKIRVPQSTIYVSTFKNLGADVVAMGFGDVYPSLKLGKLDGQENPIAVISTGRFYEVQKYISLTHHIYSVAVFLVSPDLWNRLSAAERQAFRDAARRAGKTMRAGARKIASDGLAVLRQNGMEIVETVDRDSFVGAVAPTYAGLDAKTAEMVKRIRETK